VNFEQGEAGFEECRRAEREKKRDIRRKRKVDASKILYRRVIIIRQSEIENRKSKYAHTCNQ
jgi:hypothetical protein